MSSLSDVCSAHIKLLAPAKVNLSLEIVSRRADGYHLVRSLVAPVSLYDTVRIRCAPGRGIRLSCDDSRLPAGSDNLAWRAAEAMLRATGRRVAVAIRLTKRIPAGAGLGGGSSDAAAVLTGLNVALGTRLPKRELSSVGVQLGADVPFFIFGKPAMVEGIGDQVHPLRSMPRRWLVLAWPGFSVSTRWAYADFDRSLTNSTRLPMIGRLTRRRKSLREILVNDLEAVVFAAHPVLRSLKEQVLALGAEGAMMTGSGSAIFGVFTEPARALRGAATLRRAGIWARAVQTIDDAPPYETR